MKKFFFSLLRPTLIAVSVGFILYLNRNYIYDLSVYFLTPDQQLLALYKEYLFIRMIGLPAGLLNIVFLGWFFGMQKTKSVMLQLVIINLMNVIASLYLAVYLEYACTDTKIIVLTNKFLLIENKLRKLFKLSIFFRSNELKFNVLK